MDAVKFKRSLSAAQYAALETKDLNTLYFLNDVAKIYLGDKLLGEGNTVNSVNGLDGEVILNSLKLSGANLQSDVTTYDVKDGGNLNLSLHFIIKENEDVDLNTNSIDIRTTDNILVENITEDLISNYITTVGYVLGVNDKSYQELLSLIQGKFKYIGYFANTDEVIKGWINLKMPKPVWLVAGNPRACNIYTLDINVDLWDDTYDGDISDNITYLGIHPDKQKAAETWLAHNMVVPAWCVIDNKNYFIDTDYVDTLTGPINSQPFDLFDVDGLYTEAEARRDAAFEAKESERDLAIRSVTEFEKNSIVYSDFYGDIKDLDTAFIETLHLNSQKLTELEDNTRAIQMDLYGNAKDLVVSKKMTRYKNVSGVSGEIVDSSNQQAGAISYTIPSGAKVVKFTIERLWTGDFGYGIFDANATLIEAKSYKEITSQIGEFEIKLPDSATTINISFYDDSSREVDKSVMFLFKTNALFATTEYVDNGLQRIDDILYTEKTQQIEQNLEITEYYKNYNAETESIVHSDNPASCYSIVEIPDGALSIDFYAQYVASNFGYGVYDKDNILLTKGIYNQIISTSQRIKVELPQGSKYIILSERKGNDTILVWEKVVKVQTFLPKDEVESIIKQKKYESVKSSAIGGNFATSQIESMSSLDTLELNTFPYGNKKGDRYNFSCKVETFSEITFAKGYRKEYGGRWFVINGTSVILHSQNGSNDIALESVEHNLEINTFLYININVGDDGVAKFILKTKSGIFQHDFNEWGLNSRGLCEIRNNGSLLKDCILTANNKDFKCPIWYFGASWEDVSDSRVWGQLRNLGYYNFYANAWSGRDGNELFNDFKLALNFGTPRIIIAIIANMNIDTESQINSYKTLFNNIKALCDDKGIELIVRTHPNTGAKNYDTAINPFIRESGVRIVDYYKAMKDPNKTWVSGVDNADNYDGYMVSSHPTVEGAQALALRVLTDVPEIMML